MGCHLSHEVFCEVHLALNSDTKRLKVVSPCKATVNYTLHTTSELALGHVQMVCAAEQVGYLT